MPDLTPEEVAELRAAYEASTQGEWHAVNYADTWICIQDGPDYSDADVFKSGEDNEYKSFLPLSQAEANGNFVVLAHNKFAALLSTAAEVERLRELLKRIHDWDHMDTAGDGPYWRAEIEAALTKDGTPPCHS